MLCCVEPALVITRQHLLKIVDLASIYRNRQLNGKFPLFLWEIVVVIVDHSKRFYAAGF